MFNRTRCLQSAAALASISLLSGCGMLSSDQSDTEQKLSVGTTSTPSTLDPAGAWDGSWELYRNVFQTLVSYPTGSTTPEPDAAEECAFTDSSNKVYTCTLREGLTFSDGTALDAKAAKHSIDRILTINQKGGPSGLLTSLDEVETSGDRKITFRLNKPDATFPFVLATPAMSMVSPADYPKDELRTGNQLTGSGPYTLASYQPDKMAELVKNPKYDGFADLKNDAVTIHYYQDSAVMVAALKKKEIDATFRGLTAEQVIDLEDQPKEKELQVVEATGAEIRYLVFNPKDPNARKPAVRRAIAQVVDRGALVDKVYKGTAEPLYSMIPSGVAGHATSFFDTYGEPSVPKAKNILAEAGITEPVPLTFWYTSDRYGSSTALEFAELKRQLDASGLFKITLKHRPWNAFYKGYQKGEYPVFGRGWSPDFPDPDNFVAPFVGENNAVGTPYNTPEITASLLPKTRQESDRAAVGDQFGRAQEILLEDVRLLPLWQGKLYVAASDEIAGAERALDPQTIMQVWQLHKKTSW
ncbi:ABC transporter substrate-binding protein [Streptomyces albidochromogenes]|uniref:ABC transporter substrate-binding protein n=1 Tax=Streptomyces albidochromogenes TaxID=329524 RepID=A0ABW6FKB6_9ACTN|nr:ABC transporter substrate-binding protein [Streptomyces albidochromogenes]